MAAGERESEIPMVLHRQSKLFKIIHGFNIAMLMNFEIGHQLECYSSRDSHPPTDTILRPKPLKSRHSALAVTEQSTLQNLPETEKLSESLKPVVGN
jgi:hypothetical protein